MTEEPVSARAIGAAMVRCGGSFVRHLGAALQHADPENERLIRETWPEYWTRYAAIAKQLGERG